MRLFLPQLGPLLRLALLALLLAGQSLAAAHQLSHDLHATPAGDSAQCAACSVGSVMDGALESHPQPAAPGQGASLEPEPAPTHGPATSVLTGHPRAPPANA